MHASRAEFVRVHCEAAQFGTTDHARQPLDRKAASLFFANAWKWYGRPSEPAGWRAGWHELFGQYNRGLLMALRLPGRLAHLIADLPGFFANEPIEAITFEGYGVRASHLQAVRRLAIPPRPMRLSFRCGYSSGDPAGFLVTALSSPLALAAISVNAAACGGGSALALVVARSPFLTQVKELAIDSNWLHRVDAMALAKAPGLHALERLSATGNEFGPAGEALLHDRFDTRLVL